MSDRPSSPWRLDTNDRYRELVALVIGLSTAALLLPVFLARDVLGIPETKPLVEVLTTSVYFSWGLLGTAILLGIAFHIVSAKWVRLAWSQPASIFCIQLSEQSCESSLEVTFWGAILAFIAGLTNTMWFFVTSVPGN
jgi:hypothetical protein